MRRKRPLSLGDGGGASLGSIAGLPVLELQRGELRIQNVRG